MIGFFQGKAFDVISSCSDRTRFSRKWEDIYRSSEPLSVIVLYVEKSMEYIGGRIV